MTTPPASASTTAIVVPSSHSDDDDEAVVLLTTSTTTTCTSATLSSSPSSSYNIFRDSPIRYLGYANEVGESFRYQFPHLVRPSYVLAFGYCCADAASSGWHVWNDQSYSATTNYNSTTTTTNNNDNGRTYQTALATADTLLWQTLASVMIPGATINTIVKVTRMAVASPRSPSLMAAAPLMFTKWTPTAFGLVSIPFIIHPIDAAVDYALDHTTRHWWPIV